MEASLSSERGIILNAYSTAEQLYDGVQAIMRAYLNGYPLQYRSEHSNDTNAWIDIDFMPRNFNGQWRIKPIPPEQKLLALRGKSRELIEELKTKHGFTDDTITELLKRE